MCGIDNNSAYTHRLSGLGAAMEDLKAQSLTSFDAITQARCTLPDVQELKATVSEAIESACGPISSHFIWLMCVGIAPLLDGTGQYPKAHETKVVIENLELECQRCETHLFCRIDLTLTHLFSLY